MAAFSDWGPFFERVRRARRRALMLDFDGTLAPFRVDRSRARMPPAVRRALRRAIRAGGGRLAVVSGRPGASLRRAVALAGVELWGSHGLERLTGDGVWSRPRLGRELEALLAEVFASLSAWRAVVEVKPYGLALHARRRPRMFQDARKVLLDRWFGPARRLGMELVPFEAGIELRPAGTTKGTVVESILRETGAGTAAAYLGDDWSDEDAFRALRGRGLAVLVRATPRPSLADVWIRPPGEVVRFLSRWADACASGAGPSS